MDHEIDSWTTFKTKSFDEKNLSKATLQWKEINEGTWYRVWICDGRECYSVNIEKTDPASSDQSDFETNYKTVSNKRTTSQVRIEEEPVGLETGGHFGSLDFVCNVPSGSVGDWSNHDFTWPHPVALLSAAWANATGNDGDELEVHVAPDTTIGTLSADEASGQTVLSVSATVLANIQIGYWVTITDGTNTEDLGRCLDIDRTNGTITVETALTNSYTAATPTYIKMTVKMVPYRKLRGTGYMAVMGESKIGGSYISAGTVVRIRYRNNDTAGKEFIVMIEYLY